MDRGDFLAPILAPILAPTLRILDPSTNLLGQMYPQTCYLVLGSMTIRGLSSDNDGEYCTWFNKNNLVPLLGASSYKLFDADPVQDTFINPALYSALGARGTNGSTSNLFVHDGLSADFRSQTFNFSPTEIKTLADIQFLAD